MYCRLASIVFVTATVLFGGCCRCEADKPGSPVLLVDGGGSCCVADEGAAAPSGLAILGGSPSRNNVNLTDKNLPASWSVDEKKPKNIKWSADIGDRGYGCPIVSGGKVFVSTNNAKPRDKRYIDPKTGPL